MIVGLTIMTKWISNKIKNSN